MAIYVHCPQCHEQLETMQPDCTHCGAALPPGVLAALASALGESPLPPRMAYPGQLPAHLTQITRPAQAPPLPSSPPQNSLLRPWLAAALSLLCGLGQLYNGQLAKGIVLIILGIASLLSLPLLIGKIMVPLVWGYAIVDAYLVARRSGPPAVP